MENVIRKIRPGHPEASKTMSLEQAATDADDQIRADQKSIRNLKALVGLCFLIAVLQDIGFMFGYYSWVTVPSVLIMIGCSVWSVRLIQRCKRRINQTREHRDYFISQSKNLEPDHG